MLPVLCNTKNVIKLNSEYFKDLWSHSCRSLELINVRVLHLLNNSKNLLLNRLMIYLQYSSRSVKLIVILMLLILDNTKNLLLSALMIYFWYLRSYLFIICRSLKSIPITVLRNAWNLLLKILMMCFLYLSCMLLFCVSISWFQTICFYRFKISFVQKERKKERKKKFWVKCRTALLNCGWKGAKF